MAEDPTTAVYLARIEGKIDGILAAIVRLDGTDQDHEQRIRELESHRYVTPKSMWLGLGTLFAGLSSLSSFLIYLSRS